MSIFTGIEKAIHSTVAWLEKELTALEGKAPQIEKVIDAGLAYIGPALQLALVSIGEPAAAALVGGVVAKAQNDLNAASALITDFGPTPTAASIFASVETNLNGLLAAGQITNPASIAAITKAVNEVGVLGAAISTAAGAIQSALKVPATA